MQNKICAIVDAYRSGSLLAPEFNARGYKCVHVRSGLSENYSHTFIPSDFIADVDVAGLNRFSPSCVIPGFDASVELADKISTELGLFGNSATTSILRTNKYFMNDVCAKNGLAVAQQFLASTLEEGLNWIKSKNLMPIILKPVRGVLGASVFKCDSLDEVIHHYRNFKSEVLIQEFLEGPQFSVDSVSCHGKHFIVSAVEHINFGVVIFLPWGLPRQLEAIEYVLRVLDAVEMKNGIAHSQIMMTPEGPKLIEINARIAGWRKDLFTAHCHSTPNAVVALADSICNHEKFFSYQDKPYSLVKEGAGVLLLCPRDGLRINPERLKQIKGLESLFQLELAPGVEAGGRLQRSENLATIPGIVRLSHKSKELVLNDMAVVRELEKNSFYIP